MQLLPSKLEKLTEILNRTDRWSPAVAKTAANFADISVSEYEHLIQYLIESGGDLPLGILMCVCGVNNIRLDPHVLAEALKIAEPMIDFAFGN